MDEQELQLYAIYMPHLGKLTINGGPGPHWVCSEANTMVRGYVLPYYGQEIEGNDIEDLKRNGWLPSELTFPIVAYCPNCYQNVDTEPRTGGMRVCVTCYTPVAKEREHQR